MLENDITAPWGPSPKETARAQQHDPRCIGAGERGTRCDAFVACLASVRRFLAARNRGLRPPLLEQDLEDVVQDVSLRAWEGLPRFRGEAQLLTWMVRIGTLTLAEHQRRAARSRIARLGGEALAEVHAAAGPDLDARLDLQSRALELPALEARIVTLRLAEDLTFEAIAQRVGVCPSAAHAIYTRGMGRIAALVRGPGGTRRTSGPTVRLSISPE